MGKLRPLAFVVAWAQPRTCARNPEAARPAIALPKKDLLFMRSVMLVLILNPAGRESDRFEFVTAAVEGHNAVKPRRVRCEKGLLVAQEVLQERRLWAIGFQNGPGRRA